MTKWKFAPFGHPKGYAEKKTWISNECIRGGDRWTLLTFFASDFMIYYSNVKPNQVCCVENSLTPSPSEPKRPILMGHQIEYTWCECMWRDEIVHFVFIWCFFFLLLGSDRIHYDYKCFGFSNQALRGLAQVKRSHSTERRNKNTKNTAVTSNQLIS